VGRLRRYGPVALVLAALVAAGALATVEEHGPASSPASSSAPARAVRVPPTYAGARAAGTTARFRWSPQCDRATGRLKVPSVNAPPCVPVFSGDNGGSTGNGVSGSTITVVYYQSPPGDLVAAIQGAAGTPATNLATARAYVDMFNKIEELYGRHVRLVLYNATGNSDDAVAAQTDAVRVAEQLHAFASINGPAQTPVYQQELARLHVLCISCAIGSTYSDYQKDAPYLWGLLPTPDTLLNTTWSYVIDQLNGHDAQWAGEASLRRRTRKFMVVSYQQTPPVYNGLTAELTRRFVAAHVNFVHQGLSYVLDLATLPDQAATIAAKLKASGATTVIFAGDPIMPIYLTKACAALGFYPEWVITGTVFTDTSTLGRYYNQKEWAHAFGISSLSVPVPVSRGDAHRLYAWWYGAGKDPPAPTTAGVVLPPLELLFDGIQLAGPHLTPDTFRAGLFRSPPSGGGVTSPLAAYGYQGAAPLPAYAVPADHTYIWYDAAAKGSDEEGQAGSGLIRYVDGGRRYRDNVTPTAPVHMFDPTGTVTSYPAPPPGPGNRAPAYGPWPGSPAAGG
jgi:hypothetical protein